MNPEVDEFFARILPGLKQSLALTIASESNLGTLAGQQNGQPFLITMSFGAGAVASMEDYLNGFDGIGKRKVNLPEGR